MGNIYGGKPVEQITAFVGNIVVVFCCTQHILMYLHSDQYICESGYDGNGTDILCDFQTNGTKCYTHI